MFLFMKKEKKGYKGIPLSMAFFKFPLKPSTTDLISSPSPKKMSSKSPVFPFPEPQHFSDYGFDPQLDYFQVIFFFI